MDIIQLLLKEFDEEVAGLRKMLTLVTDENLGYKPHDKSMSMEVLSVHLAELPGWIAMAMATSELDFAATPYETTKVEQAAEILTLLDESVSKGRTALSGATEADLLPSWTLRNGDQIYNTFTKYEVIRHALGQIIHHRAQLGVYLRLLNIPIPGVYGPSADEMTF